MKKSLLIIAGALLRSIVWPAPRGTVAAGNFNAGVFADTPAGGGLTKLADAAWSTRHLCVKKGTDDDHVALCGVSDVPSGMCTDSPSAAEDEVNIETFGAATRTRLGIASEAIAYDAFVVPAANGKLRTLPATTGSYYIVGQCKKAATGDGDDFTFDPCVPRLTAVA